LDGLGEDDLDGLGEADLEGRGNGEGEGSGGGSVGEAGGTTGGGAADDVPGTGVGDGRAVADLRAGVGGMVAAELFAGALRLGRTATVWADREPAEVTAIAVTAASTHRITAAAAIAAPG
jgi:hypothetical protein